MSTTADLKKELKMKLAGIIKDEDLIFNTQNKLHSNVNALAAAWDRVAEKMNKPGRFFTFLKYVLYI